MCLKRTPPLKQKRSEKHVCITISLCLSSHSDVSALRRTCLGPASAYETYLFTLNPTNTNPGWFPPVNSPICTS